MSLTMTMTMMTTSSNSTAPGRRTRRRRRQQQHYLDRLLGSIFVLLLLFTASSSSLSLVPRARTTQQQQQPQQPHKFRSSWDSRPTTRTTTTTTTLWSLTITPSQSASSVTAATAAVSSSASSVLPKTQYPNPHLREPWYSTKIQTDMQYADTVASLYVRQCVVETLATAKLAVEVYLQLSSTGSSSSSSNSATTAGAENSTMTTPSRDPFGDVAKQLSACPFTRDEGGKIGWIDNTSSSRATEPRPTTTSPELSYSQLLPHDIIAKLIELQPKAGDVHIVGPSLTTQQYHVIRVEELYIPTHNILVPTQTTTLKALTTASNQNTATGGTNKKLGSFTGVNAKIPRNKLKGHGVMPTVPNFEMRGATTTTQQPHEEASRTRTPPQPQQPQPQRTYAIQTNGCQMNVADSERLEGILQHELGLVNAMDNVDVTTATTKFTKEEINKADVIIFNTCSIRDHAEQKLYDALGPFRARKRRTETEAFALIVTGCVAQQEGLELLRKIPEIDVVLGPQYVPYLGEVLAKIEWGYQFCLTEPSIIVDNYKPYTTSNGNRHRTTTARSTTATDERSRSTTHARTEPPQRPQQTRLLPENDDFSSKPIRGHTVRSWVNVIYGCNEHCTYCVVPSTRGMEQSRSMESILDECLDLVNNRGYKEITLLGQNIDAYGRDMVPKRTFADLLHYLNTHLSSAASSSLSLSSNDNGNNNKCRLRYVTSHPRYFSDRVIDAVASLDSVCECFHMPFQAGGNDVLRRMRRGYTYESYMTIIRKIRTKCPDAAITADIIVGFPGETEQEFQRTLDLMEEVKFDNLNSFAYSARPNTEAGTWTDDDAAVSLVTGHIDEEETDDPGSSSSYFVIPEDVKKERLARVQELAVQHGMERSERYLDRIVEVLVEDTNPRQPQTQVMGRTRQGRQVFFDGTIDELKGQFVNVLITEARTWSLMGKRLTSS